MTHPPRPLTSGSWTSLVCVPSANDPPPPIGFTPLGIFTRPAEILSESPAKLSRCPADLPGCQFLEWGARGGGQVPTRHTSRPSRMSHMHLRCDGGHVWADRPPPRYRPLQGPTAEGPQPAVEANACVAPHPPLPPALPDLYVCVCVCLPDIGDRFRQSSFLRLALPFHAYTCPTLHLNPPS